LFHALKETNSYARGTDTAYLKTLLTARWWYIAMALTTNIAFVLLLKHVFFLAEIKSFWCWRLCK